MPEPILKRKDKMGFPVPLHLGRKIRQRFYHGCFIIKKAKEKKHT